MISVRFRATIAVLSAAAFFAAGHSHAQPAPAQAEQVAEVGKEAASNTAEAARTLRITWDPGATKPNIHAAVAQVVNAKVAGAIGQEVLGLSPQQTMESLGSDTPTPDNDGVLWQFRVVIDAGKYPQARLAAREFADRVAQRFADALASDQTQRLRVRLERASEEAARAAKDYEDLHERLRAYRAKMTNQAGRADASPESLRAALTKLEDERQRLELDIAGMEARQKAVERTIADTSAELQVRTKADPVVAELEKGVKAMESFVDLTRKRYEAGQATATEIAEGEAKLSDARVQYLDRKRAGASTAAGDPLAGLNRELQNLSIDLVDRTARLEYVRKRLEPLQSAADLIPQVESFADDLPRARRDLDEAKQALRETQRAAEEEQPRVRVVVIDSQDGPAKK